MKIQNVETALSIFEEASIKLSEATETGDCKKVNKFYAKIVLATNFLKEENVINKLEKLLLHESIGVRLCSAIYLWTSTEKEVDREIPNCEDVTTFATPEWNQL